MPIRLVTVPPYAFIKVEGSASPDLDPKADQEIEAASRSGCEVLVVLVTEGAGQLSAPVERERVAERMSRASRLFRRQILVVEGSGLSGDTRRLMVRALLALSHSKAELADSLSEVVARLAEPDQRPLLLTRLKAAGLLKS